VGLLNLPDVALTVLGFLPTDGLPRRALPGLEVDPGGRLLAGVVNGSIE
jgi:hypothetical protein